MSISNFSEELLDLQGVKITNIKQLDGLTEIYLEHKSRAGKCPHCGTYCGTIHDYREQRIKDIPAFGKEETHMVTETLEDSETVFYIYSHINEQPSCHSKYLIATSKVYLCW